ncbi:MAG: SGNH/GDSL hydrolase family protein [Nocardioides sp.]|uniref:SGNH/GDSL hydrolase family protein n=1 Tax=Nocardioides sp. TaxID=35761 RepID=UPI0039E61E6F
MRAPALLVVARLLSATAIGAMLVGCSVSQGAPGEAGSGGPSSVAVAPIRYVALGDSYTSGPYLTPYAENGDACLRSAANYPALVAQRLHLTSYVDVSCAAATTRDLTHGQRALLGGRLAPPQLAAVTSATDLVTIGIGGNDEGLFGSIVGACLGSGTAGCPRQFADPATLTARLASARRVEKSVGRALQQIHRRAPDARILVVGYPTLLPQTGSCARAGFPAADYPAMRRIEAILNDSLRRAAAAHDATYVDLASASRGHDICAGRDAWVSGAHSVPGKALAFHPFRSGMRGAADAIEAALGD